MDIKDLEYKEERLRKCFEDKLEHLDVDGYNEMDTVKCIKTYGALWHYTHQLLMARQKEDVVSFNGTSAETMDFKATGLKMSGGK